MSPTALRWCAVPLGLLGFTLRLLDMFWLQPLTWHMSVGVSVTLGGMVVAALVPLGILALLIGVRYRPPAALALSRGRLTASASPVYGCVQLVLLMFISGGLVVAERVPDRDAMRVARFDFVWPVAIIGVGIAWAVALAFLFVPYPSLHLDPGGLTIRRLGRTTTTIAWDELVPGGPPPPVVRRARLLFVYLNRAPAPGQVVAFEAIPIGRLNVDPAFLANAIRHYADNPPDRAAIGTEDGWRRLAAAVAGPVDAHA